MRERDHPKPVYILMSLRKTEMFVPAHPINKPTKQSVNKFTNQPTSQPANQTIGQQIYQPANHAVGQKICQS